MANRSFTITQDGSSRSFTANTGVGPAGPGSEGGVTDGNKGSVTVSASGTVWTINTGAVTNAMLAGSIEDGKISSAATWNAKQAELVSGTSIKTINGESLLGSGNIVVSAAVTATDLAGGTTLAVNGVYFDSFTAGRTLTFSGTPADGDSIELTFDASVELTIVIPTSYRLGDTGTTASITFPAGNHILKWTRRDSRWYVADSAWEASADTTAPTLSAVSATAGDTVGQLAATSNENGTMYWFVSASATPPSATDLKAGTGAVYASSEACTATVSTTQTATGLSNGTAYYLHALARDPSGNDSNISTTASFTPAAVDTTAPTLVTKSPDDGTTDIAIGANIVATFSETVFLEEFGTITIVDISTPANTISLTIPDAQVSVSGSDVTINLSTDLDPSTAYAVNISADCVRDAANNFFAGITGNTAWNFQTAASDVTAPTISGAFSPADNATDIAIGANLVITFDENVAAGAGNVTIKKTSDDSTVATIDITDGQCVFSTNTLTINPTADLANSTEYYVLIDDGAVVDTAASPNAWAGISSTTAWSFTTVAAAPVFNPADLSPSFWLDDTGASAATWSDVSGSSFDVTQAVGASQPAIVAAELNGKQVRRFDGSNDYLAREATSPQSVFGTTACAVFIVMKQTTSAVNAPFSLTNGGADRSTAFYASSTLNFDCPNDGSNRLTVAEPVGWLNNWKVCTYIRDGVNMKIRVNGTQIASKTNASGTDTPSTTTTFFYIGTFTASTFPFGGDIAEMFVVDGALTTQEITDMEDYLNSKYAIY